VVCNADEGEPGTFKDRVLLASHADLVFEGMTVCARVIGARRACSTCAASTGTCWRN
jgi:[NiFe] hydrogenase diaphorase moiety large subunit